MKSTLTNIVLFLTLGIGFHSCEPTNNDLKISDNLVKINGKIENYKGIYKTGKLTYFDVLTRDIQDKIFTVDSLGNFDLSFKLAHPIINSIYFDIEGKYFSDFLIEPNTDYEISFKDNRIRFNGKSGKKNQEISNFKDSLNIVFGERMKNTDRLHEQNLSINDYIEHLQQLENEKLLFLKSYADTYKMSEKIKSVLISEIKFKTAHAWINYRFDYSDGSRKPRTPLSEEFYIRLFKKYPIEKEEDFISRNSIDYISNIVSVLSIETIEDNDMAKYLKSLNLFSPNEIEMLLKAYGGDRNDMVTDDDDFKKFIQIYEQKLMDLDLRFNVKLLLKNSEKLDNGLIKDLVISQGISKYYFLNNLLPTSEEWNQIESKFTNKSIFNHLKKYGTKRKTTETIDEKLNEKAINSSLEQVKQKYIDRYKGKVVYIDFYATWCGPCRQEIPYAKQLHEEFKNEEVIFLNLCSKSKQEDWKNFKKQYELEGENYLLNNEEFYLLSEIYRVQGFPTYILIDKKGNIVDYNAFRPSAKKSLYDKIYELL